MKITSMPLSFLVLASLSSPMVWAQEVDIASRLGYPELIIYNAKVVTMDDSSFRSAVGTIAQAMAVRRQKILSVGTNDEIRSLAGPATRQIDLRGRTVLPGFIMTHEHPTDWTFAEPEAVKHVLPENNDSLIVVWLPAVPAQTQFEMLGSEMKQAVAKAEPGQWIELNVNRGPNYEFSPELRRGFYRQITKVKLDQWAPDNPVKVKDGSALGVVNSKAIEELKKVHEPLSMFQNVQLTPERLRLFEQTGAAGTNLRPIEPDVVFKGKTKLLADLHKAEMELWVAHGITTFASSPYSFHNFQALSYLSARGDMPARFAWGYTGPRFDQDTVRIMVGLLGQGNDYFWNVGMWAYSGGSCRTIDADPEVKALESCSFAPGSPGREILERIIREGGRIATMHSQGDRDIDYLMDAIETASKQAGMSPEEIRAKRHAFDHSGGAPRPDQLPRIKRLGMIVGMCNTYVWENGRSYNASTIARDYGAEYANWVVPRNSVTQAGIMNTFEIDRPLPHKVFFFIHTGMTRYNEHDKKVYGPGEKTDRIIQLKALTTWGSHYVLRENLLGSLAPGKLADFMVLDRDYLKIPDDDIPNIRVLMTVTGGRVVHLMPSLAQELDMPAVGPATWSTKPLENY